MILGGTFILSSVAAITISEFFGKIPYSESEPLINKQFFDIIYLFIIKEECTEHSRALLSLVEIVC